MFFIKVEYKTKNSNAVFKKLNLNFEIWANLGEIWG